MNRQSESEQYGQRTTEAYREGASGIERGLEQGMDRAREGTDEMRDGAQGAMDRAGEMAQEGRERAKEAMEAGEERAAEGMERAASEIRSRAGDMPMSGAALKAADGMERSADYLRNHDMQDLWSDIEDYVRQHPVVGIAGSVAAGFLVGRMLR